MATFGYISARAATGVAIILFLLTADANAEITCNEVTSDVSPCLSYARSGRGEPSDHCCRGVKTLNSEASTEADRQTACNCLKDIAIRNNLNADAIASLPAKCGVDVPYPISTSTDCSQVH